MVHSVEQPLQILFHALPLSSEPQPFLFFLEWHERKEYGKHIESPRLAHGRKEKGIKRLRGAYSCAREQPRPPPEENLHPLLRSALTPTRQGNTTIPCCPRGLLHCKTVARHGQWAHWHKSLLVWRLLLSVSAIPARIHRFVDQAHRAVVWVLREDLAAIKRGLHANTSYPPAAHLRPAVCGPLSLRVGAGGDQVNLERAVDTQVRSDASCRPPAPSCLKALCIFFSPCF
mmetsp:Transcript_47150/g.75976  ORF Transcript_47150/g.75976 Transcript_47150/m.75976 type:complete len:230 (+) Transcript_47150:612-1301(+)